MTCFHIDSIGRYKILYAWGLSYNGKWQYNIVGFYYLNWLMTVFSFLVLTWP